MRKNPTQEWAEGVELYQDEPKEIKKNRTTFDERRSGSVTPMNMRKFRVGCSPQSRLLQRLLNSQAAQLEVSTLTKAKKNCIELLSDLS